MTRPKIEPAAILSEVKRLGSFLYGRDRGGFASRDHTPVIKFYTPSRLFKERLQEADPEEVQDHVGEALAHELHRLPLNDIWEFGFSFDPKSGRGGATALSR